MRTLALNRLYVLFLLLLALVSAHCNKHDVLFLSANASIASLVPADGEPGVLLKVSGIAPDSWMAAVPDSVNLSHLSIPGSHNAGAAYEPVSGIAKCQNLAIADQLNIGVRFLDIRCRHIRNTFAIHHGPIYQNLGFDDVLNTCFHFLRNHPKECIVMSIKEEYNASGETRSFEETFASYVQKNPSKWYLGDTIPTLRGVRGKIVLLRRFTASQSIGIDASNWAVNKTFSIHNRRAHLRIEDDYIVRDNERKWQSVRSFLDEAKTATGNNTLYIGFTSGYKPLMFSIPNITTVSKQINTDIASYFTTHTKGRFGIIPMDFAEPAKTLLIINTNF